MAQQAPGAAHWDQLVASLKTQRASAGDPSYRELADRVTSARVAGGMDPYAARVGKSTVYDCFQTGRLRMNLELVREVARAMGADDPEIETWIKECRTPLPNQLETTGDRRPAPDPTLQQAVTLMVICLVVNLTGRTFVDYFDLPVYLDMVGTAIVAIALGPWHGALVGATTNVVGAIGSGLISMPFALVNVVGALVWGYGVRRWRMGHSLPRFFLLNVVTAIACSIVAVPIIALSLQRDLRVGNDIVTQLIDDSVDTFVLALGFSNILTSTTDKLLSGFIALVVITALPAAFHKRFPVAVALRDASETNAHHDDDR